MSLNFPNASRSYDATRRCVCFWGYDSTFEVPFYVDESALTKLSTPETIDEASSLQVFDENRSRIQQAAGTAYGRQRQKLYRLSAAEF